MPVSGHALSPELCQQTLDALERCGGVQTRAAESLGLKRTTYVSRLQDARVWRAGLNREAPAPAHVQYEPQAPPESPPQIPLAVRLKDRLKRGACTLSDLTAVTNLGENATLGIIADLEAAGFNVCKFGDQWTIEKTTPATESPTYVGTAHDLPTLISRPDNTFLIGASGDQHLGSKYHRADVLSDLYDRFERAQVQAVYNTGNWIEGESRFNKHDLLIHGMDAQLRYLAENFPQRPGIVTYAVSGDDHEGWYGQREGVDIGRYAERAMRDAGRTDWVHLGFMEAFVRLVNANTGASSIMSVVHPGGGSAYALSYSIQKIIEALDGGEKPAVGLYGHYHKLWAGNIRNVWCVQTGCAKDQDPFMRKNKIDAHVGGVLVGMEQDPKTGAIIGFTPQMIRYFNKGYYADRWSHAGGVTHPERAA